ncbi:type I restriction enzyme EcoR124II R protein [Campylobacter upsaliensis]|uniref:type I restriction endonuclease subunit R n=1 Tax=Campylobacter upsaliensis TaxID=28080 RepID=UPI000E1230A8|nr:type I restriction endonuclease subunit R [Campylobacter upsaliensis]EAH6228353.1 type I restriction endonuclease subunit R [Campylobacter upsaliensis]EAI4345029.1 type I restriction endonuclease subunit R [Campylobacter upsaliensis]EAJ7827034.1 type I restriction endonuclease subunit R [Campylobacter upsaliensis]EAK1170985.1 type I restriction endonuclease subunit R [Campylobacter upsaliensis]EAK7295550.1 type I restriction endonuclease subunit R [Campylobacter upsaliensis]
MKSLKLLAQNTTSTIAVEFTPSKRQNSSYQSEAQLEKELIATLQAQGYEYAKITDEKSLESNLRTKLEELNSTTLSDTEWRRFFAQVLSRANASIVEKSVLIQEDYIQPLERDNGSIINFKLIDKADIHKNSLQVINQYEATTPTRSHRYDVTILVNGLPLVHIELKRRGVSLKEAFNQINRYGRESFFKGNGLFEFVQIFVISNGTQSKYYSNTTRDLHIKTKQGIKTTKTSNTFEFTSYFSDEKNTIIDDLIDFAKTFFARHTLLQILCHYCVLDVDRKLLVLRPYQIAACEKILQQIAISYHNKFYEKSNGQKSGGYIWHTTGSGKTLTSFKTAQLVSKIQEIAKVLFVVDRKDLDYQTMREYDRFQKGAATGSKSTKELQSRLNSIDKNHKIIITTIQKLSRFIAQAEKDHTIFNEHIVMIFDECHRSQFGQMQKDITKAFKKLYLFGFTGTPIFAANALGFETTQRVFGECLHRYTIIHAIRDHNVLPFRVDYHTTTKDTTQITDEILLNPTRIEHITRYILEHFTTHTKRNAKSYNLNGKHTLGFNALFATQSIPMAMRYYEEFKRQQAHLSQDEVLKIGIIYSYAPNDELEEENSEDTTALPKSQRDFLDAAISDYNAIFACRFDSSADNFQNYYKDFSLKLKNRELDLAIVVNMFLTGFDATTLNTLYVDKSLRYHGLLQAYSRTNRILNSVKSFGNIIAFRDLQKNTDDALALFSDENAKGIVFLRSLEEYLHGYTDEKGQKHKGYNELLQELTGTFPLENFRQATLKTSQKKHFLSLFGELLKLRNILEIFDDFSDSLSDRDKQDYQSHYISTYEELRKDKDEQENALDEVEFEVELLAQVEVSIEYILELIAKYHKDQATSYEPILKLLDSSLSLRSKRELFLRFIDSLHDQSNVAKDFSTYIKMCKDNALQDIIDSLNLDPKKTKNFMQDSFERGELRSYGKAFNEIYEGPLFGDEANQTHTIRQQALQKLQAFFELFKGLDISNKEQ